MAEIEKGGTAHTDQISGGAGAEQNAGGEGAVPKVFEPYIGQDGKVDLNKAGASVLELQKKLYSQGKEQAALKRAYDALAAGKADAPERDPEEERGEQFENFVREPKQFTEGVAREVVSQEAKAFKAAILGIAHPELNDPEWKKGLDEFAATMPPAVQAHLDDYFTADWVVKQYKDKLGETAAPGTKSPTSQHIESPSGAAPKDGKIWKRSEIKRMQADDPDKYNRLADEISNAYNEGRVLKDE